MQLIEAIIRPNKVGQVRAAATDRRYRIRTGEQAHQAAQRRPNCKRSSPDD